VRLPHRVKCVCVEHGLLLAKADARIQHCKCRLFRRAAFGHSLVVVLHLPCSVFGKRGSAALTTVTSRRHGFDLPISAEASQPEIDNDTSNYESITLGRILERFRRLFLRLHLLRSALLQPRGFAFQSFILHSFPFDSRLSNCRSAGR